jgi:hypothetical protein
MSGILLISEFFFLFLKEAESSNYDRIARLRHQYSSLYSYPPNVFELVKAPI